MSGLRPELPRQRSSALPAKRRVTIAARREPPSKGDDLVFSAVEFYKSKNYDKAMGLLREACHLCPCNRIRTTCKNNCRDWVAAAQKDAILEESLAGCKCQPSTTTPKCAQKYHMQAVNYRVAIYAAQDNWSNARKAAEHMLELFPTSAPSYLRFIQVMNNQMPDNAELLYSIARSGVAACAPMKGNTNDSHYQLLLEKGDLYRRRIRRDPLQVLPKELAVMVAQQLAFGDLCRMMCVSKDWNRFLQSDPAFWTTYDFNRSSERGITSKSLHAMFARSRGSARAIRIADCRGLSIENQKLLWILFQCTKLETLDFRLHSISPSSKIGPMMAGKRWESVLLHLKTLYLGERPLYVDAGSEIEHEMATVHRELRIIEAAANTLESLTFLCASAGPIAWLGALPKLKYLRMGCTLANCTYDPGRLYLPNLAQVTPVLEQLWLQGYGLDNAQFDAWPRLTALILDRTQFYLQRQGTLPSTLKDLTLERIRGNTHFPDWFDVGSLKDLQLRSLNFEYGQASLLIALLRSRETLEHLGIDCTGSQDLIQDTIRGVSLPGGHSLAPAAWQLDSQSNDTRGQPLVRWGHLGLAMLCPAVCVLFQDGPAPRLRSLALNNFVFDAESHAVLVRKAGLGRNIPGDGGDDPENDDGSTTGEYRIFPALEEIRFEVDGSRLPGVGGSQDGNIKFMDLLLKDACDPRAQKDTKLKTIYAKGIKGRYLDEAREYVDKRTKEAAASGGGVDQQQQQSDIKQEPLVRIETSFPAMQWPIGVGSPVSDAPLEGKLRAKMARECSMSGLPKLPRTRPAWER